jgi:hypothetical protein
MSLKDRMLHLSRIKLDALLYPGMALVSYQVVESRTWVCTLMSAAHRGDHFFADRFRFAQAAFIRSDIILRYAASPRDTLFFAATGALVGAAFGVAATGAAAAAFAALIRAHRAFVASTIRLRPAALSLRFFFGAGAGSAFGMTGSGA